MNYQVSVDTEPSRLVLRLHRNLATDRLGEDISEGMRELYTTAERTGLQPFGPPAITYRGEFAPGRAIEADFELPIVPDIPEGTVAAAADVVAEVVEEPATTVAHTRHRGAYDTIGEAHRALEEWLAASGRAAAGPPTETYLVGPDEVADPGGLLTDVRVPIKA